MTFCNALLESLLVENLQREKQKKCSGYRSSRKPPPKWNNPFGLLCFESSLNGIPAFGSNGCSVIFQLLSEYLAESVVFVIIYIVLHILFRVVIKHFFEVFFVLS
jgi:hypothetical protein